MLHCSTVIKHIFYYFLKALLKFWFAFSADGLMIGRFQLEAVARFMVGVITTEDNLVGLKGQKSKSQLHVKLLLHLDQCS